MKKKSKKDFLSWTARFRFDVKYYLYDFQKRDNPKIPKGIISRVYKPVLRWHKVVPLLQLLLAVEFLQYSERGWLDLVSSKNIWLDSFFNQVSLNRSGPQWPTFLTITTCPPCGIVGICAIWIIWLVPSAFWIISPPCPCCCVFAVCVGCDCVSCWMF